jgi:hypothetical protein
LTRARIEQEMRYGALFDPRKLLRKTGRGQTATFTLKAIAELPDDVALAIESYDVVLGNENRCDGHLETVVKVRWLNKTKALELCARALGMLKDVHQVIGLDERKARLRTALARKDQSGGE